jgi:DNA polymerase III subunit epsilon
MTHEIPAPFNLETVVEWLKSQDYRVTRPFLPRTSYCDASPPPTLLKAAILDTETTGINHHTDKIIELGMVIVEYCPDTGQVYRVLETYNELEDPGIPIPLESIKIHGIADEMVQGKKITDSIVENLLSDVSLIIAHNAGFDRKFVEARFPFLDNKAWACTFTQIPWKNENIRSAALEFLGFKFGFHFDGHRASLDCHALLEILQSELPQSKIKVFKMLLDNAYVPDYKIWALETSFDTKDKLKEHGYRWNNDRRTWHKNISNENLRPEIEWLRTEVYADRGFRLEQEIIDSYSRFSTRSGISQVICYEPEF